MFSTLRKKRITKSTSYNELQNEPYKYFINLNDATEYLQDVNKDHNAMDFIDTSLSFEKYLYSRYEGDLSFKNFRRKIRKSKAILFDEFMLNDNFYHLPIDIYPFKIIPFVNSIDKYNEQNSRYSLSHRFLLENKYDLFKKNIKNFNDANFVISSYELFHKVASNKETFQTFFKIIIEENKMRAFYSFINDYPEADFIFLLGCRNYIIKTYTGNDFYNDYYSNHWWYVKSEFKNYLDNSFVGDLLNNTEWINESEYGAFIKFTAKYNFYSIKEAIMKNYRKKYNCLTAKLKNYCGKTLSELSYDSDDDQYNDFNDNSHNVFNNNSDNDFNDNSDNDFNDNSDNDLDDNSDNDFNDNFENEPTIKYIAPIHSISKLASLIKYYPFYYELDKEFINFVVNEIDNKDYTINAVEDFLSESLKYGREDLVRYVFDNCSHILDGMDIFDATLEEFSPGIEIYEYIAHRMKEYEGFTLNIQDYFGRNSKEYMVYLICRGVDISIKTSKSVMETLFDMMKSESAVDIIKIFLKQYRKTIIVEELFKMLETIPCTEELYQSYYDAIVECLGHMHMDIYRMFDVNTQYVIKNIIDPLEYIYKSFHYCVSDTYENFIIASKGNQIKIDLERVSLSKYFYEILLSGSIGYKKIKSNISFGTDSHRILMEYLLLDRHYDLYMKYVNTKILSPPISSYCILSIIIRDKNHFYEIIDIMIETGKLIDFIDYLEKINNYEYPTIRMADKKVCRNYEKSEVWISKKKLCDYFTKEYINDTLTKITDRNERMIFSMWCKMYECSMQY